MNQRLARSFPYPVRSKDSGQERRSMGPQEAQICNEVRQRGFTLIELLVVW